MKHAFVASCLVVILVGCTSQPQKTVTPIDTVKTVTVSPARPAVKAKKFVEINQILYDSLVVGGLSPYAVKNDSGYYVLDLDAYHLRLQQSEVFSEEFFKHEQERMKQCGIDLEQLKFDGEPEEGWAPESCFFEFMYWLQSQESPNGYEIKSLKEEGDTASATMSFYFEHNGERSYWDQPYLAIHYRKEAGEWKVAQIDRLPE
jgi:hypothetical protein